MAELESNKQLLEYEVVKSKEEMGRALN